MILKILACFNKKVILTVISLVLLSSFTLQCAKKSNNQNNTSQVLINTHTLTIQRPTNGNVTITSGIPGAVICNPSGTDNCIYPNIASGTNVTLQVIVANTSTHELASWGGADSDRCTTNGMPDNPCTLNINTDIIINPVIDPISDALHTFTLQTPAGGSVAITIGAESTAKICSSESPANCSNTNIPMGIEIILEATANSDHTFSAWNGIPGCSSGLICTFAITRDIIDASATFIGGSLHTLIIQGTANSGSIDVIGTPGGGKTCSLTDSSSNCMYTNIPGNTLITLNALPNDLFNAWGPGPCISESTSMCSFNITANTTISPTFNIRNVVLPRDLTILRPTNGTIGVVIESLSATEPCEPGSGTTCQYTMIENNKTITLTATPNVGFAFNSWNVITGNNTCNASVDPICTFQLNADTTIEPVFVDLSTGPFSLTIASPSNGMINIAYGSVDMNCPTACSLPNITKDTEITLTAMPTTSTTHSFRRWEGTDANLCASASTEPDFSMSECIFMITKDTTIGAHFPPLRTLTLNRISSDFPDGSGGLIANPGNDFDTTTTDVGSNNNCAKSGCSIPDVPEGTVRIFTALVGTASRVKEWTGCDNVEDVDISSGGSTTTVINGKCTVTVDGDKSITLEIESTSSDITFSIQPPSGYDTSNGDITIGIAAGRILTGDCSTYSTSPSTPCTVESGTEFLLTASPSDGYRVNWVAGCSVLDPLQPNQCHTSSITASRVVQVHFIEDEYTITIKPYDTSATGGSIVIVDSGGSNCTADGSTEVICNIDSGNILTFTATLTDAADNYEVQSWGTDSCVVSPNECMLTVMKDETITVQFGVKTIRTLTVTPPSALSMGSIKVTIDPDGTPLIQTCTHSNTACVYSDITTNRNIRLEASSGSANHLFQSWENCPETPSDNICEFGINSDATIGANFSTFITATVTLPNLESSIHIFGDVLRSQNSLEFTNSTGFLCVGSGKTCTYDLAMNSTVIFTRFILRSGENDIPDWTMGNSMNSPCSTASSLGNSGGNKAFCAVTANITNFMANTVIGFGLNSAIQTQDSVRRTLTISNPPQNGIIYVYGHNTSGFINQCGTGTTIPSKCEFNNIPNRTRIALRAVPNDGYTIGAWPNPSPGTGCIGNHGAWCSVQLDQNRTISQAQINALFIATP